MLKKFMVYGLWFMVLAFFASPAFAQTAGQTLGLPLQPTTYNLPTTVSPTSPLYTDLLVNNLFHTFSCLAVGQSMIDQPCLTYLQGVPVLSKVNTSGGVLGSTTNLIGMLYQNPPVRTADYLASVGQGLGLVKTANAQVTGSGANVLSPILKLWETSRNISYVLMIIIFLVIGLMVMFRNKLNPQTVITAQAALPGLVIGLIMITFSFFFAGLISDMAFVGTNVVGYYFVAAQGNLSDPTFAQQFAQQLNLSQALSSDSVISIFSQFTGIITRDNGEAAAISILDKMDGAAATNLRILVGLIAAQFASPLTSAIPPPLGIWLSPLISTAFGLEASATPTFWLGFIIGFVATLALIYQMLKLLLKLLTTYLTIIFLTITAPFQLLFASLPGRQGVATGWIMNMLGNILVFPAVLAVFYFVAFILGESKGLLQVSYLNQQENRTFISEVKAAGPDDPNMIVGANTFPLFGGLNLGFVKVLLAFGALMALPTIPDIVVKAVGKAGQAGQMIGQELSGGIRSGQGYLAQGRNAAGGQIGGWNKGLMGEITGPVWNPEAHPILDRAGNPTGRFRGDIVYPRRPGLLRR